MHQDYQLLVREQLICGTQVHVDVPDRDVAVAVAHRLCPWLPVRLALSASSPFWMGEDSGYASSRSLAWQRWPTAGGDGSTTAAEHDALVAPSIHFGRSTAWDPVGDTAELHSGRRRPDLQARQMRCHVGHQNHSELA